MAGFVLLLVLFVGSSVVTGEDYGSRLGSNQGGELTFAPQGAGVLFNALDPAVKRWYVPQELFNEYRWQQSQYTNYARDPFQRYVDVSLEGDYFYDLFGDFVSKGWLIYDWRQTQPRQFGNSIYKDGRFGSWFSNILISSDRKGEHHYSVTVGQPIRTTLTPMTFSKVAFDGIQADYAADKYHATVLLSRVNSPGATNAGLPLEQTNSTVLMGGRVTTQIGDFATVGATYVNGHQAQTLQDNFLEDVYTGSLTVDQNAIPISWIEIHLKDDSPEDGEGGATYFPTGSDIIITYTDGFEEEGEAFGFSPIVQGGFAGLGSVSADGEETIRIRYDFDSPAFLTGAHAGKADIEQVRFRLVLSNDYQVWLTSNRQSNRSGQPVLLLVTQAKGNVKDNSSQRLVEFEYGLPTGNQILGYTLELQDVQGFQLYLEHNINHRFRKYPSVGQQSHSASSGILGQEFGEAWMVNLSRQSYPWFLFAEGFSMDPEYTTDVFLTSGSGLMDYETLRSGRFEFVDDNDDQDRFPDWDRVFEPNEEAVFPGWDENNDFVSDFNQNDNDLRPNLIPDYEEPFLRINVDPPEFLFGIDLNNNVWIDRFENDETADYPYKKDHRGYNLYAGAHIIPEARVSIGQVREGLISSNQENVTTYGLFTLERDFAGLGKLRLFDMVKRAKDDLPDHLLQWVQPFDSRGEHQQVRDPMRAQDTWINTAWLGFDYRAIPSFKLDTRLKYEVYDQRGEKSEINARGVRPSDHFFGFVNKASYVLEIGRFRVQPNWKSLLRLQTYDILRPEKRRELTQIYNLLLDFPLLARTTIDLGVEHMRVNDLRKQTDDDFWEVVSAAQLSNTTDYLGYLVTLKTGFDVTTRKSAETGDTTNILQTFITIIAGLE